MLTTTKVRGIKIEVIEKLVVELKLQNMIFKAHKKKPSAIFSNLKISASF